MNNVIVMNDVAAPTFEEELGVLEIVTGIKFYFHQCASANSDGAIILKSYCESESVTVLTPLFLNALSQIPSNSVYESVWSFFSVVLCLLDGYISVSTDPDRNEVDHKNESGETDWTQIVSVHTDEMLPDLHVAAISEKRHGADGSCVIDDSVSIPQKVVLNVVHDLLAKSVGR